MKKIMIKNPVLVRFGMILVLALAISSIVSSFFLGSRMRQENVEMMEKTISVVEYTLNTDKPVAGAAAEGSCLCTGCECSGYDNRKRRNSAC